ncbi:MAG: S41 family peptidase [Ruminococcaceae bacterium]|nr:S41 family peptidase [Oscillospiraceae bacterium]
MKKMCRLTAFVLVFAISLSLSGCMLLEGERETIEVPPIARSDVAYQKKVNEILSIMDKYYIDGYDTKELDDYLARAAVEASGDRWSVYMTAEEYAKSIEEDNNAYVGIGVTVQRLEDESGYIITEVNKNGSAREAGVKVNDKIVSVEGESASKLDMDGLSKAIRGEEGTTVQITVQRGEELIDLTITRKTIQIEVLTYMLLEGSVGYIKLAQFTHDTANMTIKAVEELKKQGATSLVFDMRYNPGGFKSELVELLDYLLPKGPLFRSVDYNGKEEVDHSDSDCLEMPMAVLINKDSYSAAEFFAAALQEYDWATVVGTKTTGKANYQETFKLSDGSAIRISTGHYQTPNGVSLEGVGVTPDVIVEVDEETYYAIYNGELAPKLDEQLQAAISAVKK